MSVPTRMPGRLDPVLIDTSRLRINCWTAGPPDGVPVLLVHGNLVSGRWWDLVAARLPEDLLVVAPDLRGFGRSETVPIDATRGLRDFGDDLRALVETLGWAGEQAVHLAGWSMGGGICDQYAIDYPDDLATIALVAPLSPYGYGGTKDVAGTPSCPDCAGSGAGAASPEFTARIVARDTTGTDPLSPRSFMRTYFASPEFAGAIEDELLDEVLRTAVGPANYPGDAVETPNWPGVGPGTGGTQNAMSPRWCDTSAFATAALSAPVLWVRGDRDQVISDESPLDFGTLGRLGHVPGWPGAGVFPPQPQIAQTRAMLDRRRAEGGRVREVVLEDTAHGVPVDRPAELADLLVEHLRGAHRSAVTPL